MRPLTMTISGLRSYSGLSPEIIDWSEKSLVAVTGPTGAGKSSIFEAITFALFGNCSWSEREIAKLLAHGADEMSVELVFLHDTARWRILRTFYRNTRPSIHLLENPDTGETFDNATAVNAKIVSLLGLTPRAFHLVALLHQGRFDSLLTASDAQRIVLLNELLGLEEMEAARELVSQRLQGLERALADARVARKELEDDPAASAARAEAEAETERRNEARADTNLGTLRDLQTSWEHALRDQEALAAARAAIAQHGEDDHRGTLAALGPVEEDLQSREAEILTSQAAIAAQLEKLEQDIAALAGQGLTPDSLARADQTLTSAPADVEHLREREIQLAAREHEIADMRSELTNDAEELAKLAGQRESAAQRVLASRTALQAATQVSSEVREALDAAVGAAQSTAFARGVANAAATALAELEPQVQQAADEETAAEAAATTAQRELSATSGVESAQQTVGAVHDVLGEAITTGVGSRHLCAELDTILERLGALTDEVNNAHTQASAAREEHTRLQQAASGFTAQEDQVDDAYGALNEAVTQALACGAEVRAIQAEATDADLKLSVAQDLAAQAERHHNEGKERAADTATRLEKMRGAQAAAGLALHISPGDQCPVCTQNVPPGFKPPELGSIDDLSTAETQAAHAKTHLADVQHEHATALANARTALETKATLAKKLTEARVRLDAHLDKSTTLYGNTTAVLTAVGIDVTGDATSFRPALVNASNGAAPGGGSSRAALLRPISTALDTLAETHDALREKTATARAKAVELETQAKNLSAELRKTEKSRSATQRKADKERSDFDAAVGALSEASTQASTAIAAVDRDGAPNSAEFVANAIACIDDLASRPNATARERTKAARLLLTPFYGALEEAAAHRSELERNANEATRKLTAATATARGKSEELLRASQDLTAKRLVVDQKNALCATRLDTLIQAYGHSQAAFAEVGRELSLGVEEFAAACRSMLDDLSRLGERSGDGQTAGSVLGEIDATLEGLAEQAESHSRAEAAFAAEYASRSEALASKKKSVESFAAQWGKDGRSLDEARQQYAQGIDTLPAAYRAMLAADPLQVTAIEAERVRKLVTNTISKINTLRGQEDSARKQGRNLERSLAALHEERELCLVRKLRTMHESLRQEIADIARQATAVDATRRPDCPSIPGLHEMSVTTLQRFAEATAVYRANALEDVTAREGDATARVLKATSAIDELRIELDRDGTLRIEGSLTAPAALVEGLVAVRERARAQAEHAERQRDRALGQIPRASALDGAITAAATRASALEDVKKLLQKDKFLAYVTSRRTMALLGLASTLFGTLSSGQFGFAADFQIVERPTGAARDPKTLSGGEKFLASLALALSLVEMYSHSGPRIDTLFLDEGFASLDEDTLDTALEVVRRQAGDGRLVVVISHLHAVAEAVTDVLMVDKPATGSRTRWLTGPERDALLDEELRAGLLTVT